MTFRIILSVLTIFGSWFLSSIYQPVSTLVLGNVAGNQFQPSDGAYLQTQAIFTGFHSVDFLFFIVPLVILLFIWFGPLKKLWLSLSAIALAIFILTGTTNHSYAFYDKTDMTEVYSILPNESAFWVPSQGDNLDNQQQLDTEAYYEKRKISTKFFAIPHQKLSGSAGYSMFSGYDFYVPTGRLILVDRTPQSREWAKPGRGTSKTDESFPCQSNEGLDITVEVSISASVDEQSASKFLYNFGVIAPKTTDQSNPQVIFQSVYYGRSLAEVMDDNVRKRVQTLVCNEIGKRDFDTANKDMVPIMDAVEKQSKDYLATVGISLKFIGWGGTWTFDPYVQTVVNQYYEAKKLKDSITILQEVAQLKVQEGLGSGLDKHGLPMVITPGMFDAIVNMGKSVVAPFVAQTPSELLKK
ncbi:MAG: hypothetical protein ACYDBV_14345 [Nitrospiria bacterium]